MTGNRVRDCLFQRPMRRRGAFWEASRQAPLPLGAVHAGTCSPRLLPAPSFPAARLRCALGVAMLPLGRFLARRAWALGSRAHARHYAEPAAAGQAQMAFTFASPSQVYYNAANVKQVDVPTMSGSFGILAAHVPTLQVLKPGVVTVFAEDGSSTKYFISSGSITVNADSSVQLLAEEVAMLDQLDAATAKSNLEKALSQLASASDEAAKAEAQISVEANEAIVKALE